MQFHAVNVKRGNFSPWSLGVLIGFGPWLPVTMILGVLITIYSLRRSVLIKIDIRTMVQLGIVIFLILTYFIGSEGEVRSIDVAKAFVYVYTIMFVVLSLATKGEANNFLFAIVIGMLVNATLVSVVTVLTLDPPYYGRTLNPFTGEIANSPDASNFALFFAAMFLTQQFASSYQIKAGVWLIVSAAGLLVSITIGLLMAARTYFIFLLSVLIFILIRRSAIGKSHYSGLIVLFAIFVIDTFLYISSDVYRAGREQTILRFSEYGFASNSRADLQAHWLEQFLSDPFKHAVTSDPISLPWFHNFWMDLHANSGFFPLLFASALAALSTIYLLRIRRNDQSVFYIWLLMFSITMFISASSVLSINHPVYLLFIAQSLIFARFCGPDRLREPRFPQRFSARGPSNL